MAFARLRLALMLFASLSAGQAAAEFSATKRSINGTGETLPAGEVEASLSSVAIGVTDDVMLRVPSLALLVGRGRVEARKKFSFADDVRFSPYVFVETPRHAGLGGDVGFDFGAQKEHSLTAGARLRHGPLALRGDGDPPRVRRRNRLLPNLEYDYYWNGNVSFVGMSDWLPYAGHTWAFNSFHVGLIMSPSSGLLPLPYVYWRF